MSNRSWRALTGSAALISTMVLYAGLAVAQSLGSYGYDPDYGYGNGAGYGATYGRGFGDYLSGYYGETAGNADYSQDYSAYYDDSIAGPTTTAPIAARPGYCYVYDQSNRRLMNVYGDPMVQPC